MTLEHEKKQFILDETCNDPFVKWCITYTFMPDELEDILKHYGVKNIKLAGPGAYARTHPNELPAALGYIHDS